MTNAEVYIGDEDLIDQFIDEFDEFACEQDCAFEYHYLKEMLVRFFKKERKPTLTEDERVILRNINKRFNRIERNKFGFLILTENGCENVGEAMHTLYAFNHLFQFIKERRRV